ncbi:MAG: hypothetical protein KDA42_08925 [Planctomycetales bacterium]|nr:hypothetical protein [Planctomycetales bacterium]
MVTCASLMLAATLLSAAPDTARWTNDYGLALTETRQTNRPLLVMLDNPNDPEQAVANSQIKPTGFTASTLQRYHLCRVDVSTDYGKEVAKVFRASEFPSAVIIDPTGRQIIYRRTGRLSDSEWDSILTQYQDGICVT